MRRKFTSPQLGRRTLLVWPAVLLWIGSASINAGLTQSSSPAPTSSQLPHRATLDKFCVACHNARLRTAALELDLVDIDHPEQNAAVWEKVLHKLRTLE